MQEVIFEDLGSIPYQEAWDYQLAKMKGTVDLKLSNRGLEESERKQSNHYLLFCEHPHVYTLGKSGSMDNLRLNDKELASRKISFFKINRGGDITYHGPGQIVGYPIFDLDYFFTDIHRYVRLIEEVSIRTIADYGINGIRIEGASGVWLEDEGGKNQRKICAIGVHLSRWVTMHGFAFNVNTDLNYFEHIIPCGLTDKGVTSLAKELGRKVDEEEVKNRLKTHFSDLFQFKFV